MAGFNLNEALFSGGLTFQQPQEAAKSFSQSTGQPYTWDSTGQVAPRISSSQVQYQGGSTSGTSGGSGGGTGGQPSAPADSKLQQYQKMLQSGGLNPVQQREYEEMMGGGISEMYQPTLNALGDAERFLKENNANDEVLLGEQYDNELAKYGTQGNQLLQDTEMEEGKFNKVLRSAYEDAVRAYNALKQQGGARFGMGSSAGQAVGELAQQEFFRQQGKVQDRGVEGSQQFAIERTKIKSYIDEKTKDLGLYKKQALADLKKQLQAGLNEIALRKGEVEANKTRDKLAILQSARDRANAIQDADKQFRQQLGLAAVQHMQELSGRTFTPAEIKATMAEFVPELPFNIGTTTTPQGVTAAKRPIYAEDEIAQTNPFG